MVQRRHLGEANDRRRDWRRGAARFGGRRRGRDGAERSEETLAPERSDRDSDPADRQAISLRWRSKAKAKEFSGEGLCEGLREQWTQ